MNLFREQLESYKKKIGIEKAESTYRGLVADYKNLLLFMKSKKNTEDIVIEELEKSFIEDYYNWMLGTCALANSTAFGRVNTLKWLMYIAQEKGWIRVHPFASFECMPEYKRRSFLSEEELQRIIRIELRYKRQRAIRDMFLFMCFTGLSYADLKTITYDNIHTDSDGGTWLMGNRQSWNHRQEMQLRGEVTPHIGRHTFAVLAILKGMPLETLQKVLGHKSILSTQVYAELINPKVGEDTDRICEKIGHVYKLAM